MSRKHVSTRRRLHLEALEDRLCLSSLPVGTSTTAARCRDQARLSAAYGQLPLSFEANQGQTDSQVNFLSRGTATHCSSPRPRPCSPSKQGDTKQRRRHANRRGQPAARAVGLDKQAGVSNYLIGNDPSKWHTDIPNYGQGRLPGRLPRHRPGLPRRPEAARVRLRRRPRRRPRAIRLAFDGMRSASLDRAGNLVLHTSGGDVVEHAPVVYQEVNGQHQAWPVDTS